MNFLCLAFFFVLTSAWSAQITTDLSDKILLPILAKFSKTSAKIDKMILSDKSVVIWADYVVLVIL